MKWLHEDNVETSPGWCPRVVCLVMTLMAMLSILYGETSQGRGRHGEIQFSNGQITEGWISVPDDTKFKLHIGDSLRTFGLEDVIEIRFTVEKESMERAWRFVEAGRTEKEFTGPPYPVREIGAIVTLQSGEKMAGHLYTTSLFVESEGVTSKIILRSKLRGEPGQAFEDLKFPVRIALTGQQVGHQIPGEIVCHLRGVMGDDKPEIALLTKRDLVRLVGRASADGTAFSLHPASEEGVFLAVRRGSEIVVGWPSESDLALVTQFGNTLREAKDFFDKRELLGVLYDEEGANVYTLVLLQRSAPTTLSAHRSRPWRVGVWRWKKTESERFLLAAQGYFFRGINAPDEALPSVRCNPKLWNVPIRNGMIVDLDAP
ncbi:MAG: hypothetical protein N2255_09365 [Kiritimatiellae bacterium]|nr:hypothetical protein [Kiritimatiellia bacterium]